MENLSTKENILKQALHLFSVKGYKAVSVAQIADAVGIKAPSLYKHYKNKQAIFNAIVAEMTSRYQDEVSTMQLNGMEAEKDLDVFANVGEQHLIEMVKQLFSYILHDDDARAFRQLLAIEQYHNFDLANLYIKQYIDGPLLYQGKLFEMFVASGIMETDNLEVMALHFYSPIFVLLTQCDCHPEREIKALQLLEQHVVQFNKLYQIKEAGGE